MNAARAIPILTCRVTTTIVSTSQSLQFVPGLGRNVRVGATRWRWTQKSGSKQASEGLVPGACLVSL